MDIIGALLTQSKLEQFNFRMGWTAEGAPSSTMEYQKIIWLITQATRLEILAQDRDEVPKTQEPASYICQEGGTVSVFPTGELF